MATKKTASKTDALVTSKTAAKAAKTTKVTKATKAAKPVAKTTVKKVTPKTAAKKSTTTAAAKSTAKNTTKAAKAPAKKVTKKATIATKQDDKQKKTGAGFIDFLREQSVVGLAIGLIIGAQTKALADQLIASFINPLIGLVLPGKGALDQKMFIMHLDGKSATFAWGSFLAVLLSFVTTAAVVYFVFKFLKLDRLTKKKEAEA